MCSKARPSLSVLVSIVHVHLVHVHVYVIFDVHVRSILSLAAIVHNAYIDTSRQLSSGFLPVSGEFLCILPV